MYSPYNQIASVARETRGGLIRTRITTLQAIEGASDTAGAFVEYVGVDHGRADVGVAQEFLDGTDVVTVFKELGGKGVSERVATGMFLDAGKHDGVADCPLED